jgi:ATP-dependent Clp protease ATP-binding subunit ClpA
MAEAQQGGDLSSAGGPYSPLRGLDVLQGPWTERFKETLGCAAEVCDQAEAERLLPDHLWLGLLRASKGAGLMTLERCGISLDALRTQVNSSIVKHPPQQRRLSARWSSTCLSIIATALKRSEETPHLSGYVGTEHLVWALLDVDADGSRWLREQGLDTERYVMACLMVLGAEPDPAGPSSEENHL